jgi:dinuclear metal center YbgI/SA1388 family protein
MSPVLQDVTTYLDEFLQTAATPDYPQALNGLQLENRSEIKGIAAAVDFSTRAVHEAIAKKANLLVVHHGMFWAGLERFSGSAYAKIRTLIEADVAVYSSHLPLDRHPTLGNNVLLAKQLGLEVSGPFARFQEIFVGVSGYTEMETSEIVKRTDAFAQSNGGTTRTSLFREGRRTKRWAICTGAGASAETLRQASAAGIDTLIVGEGPHWTAVHAEENDLALIYAGHYATETLGVRALAKHLGERFDLPWHFVNAPTGL